MCAVAYKTASQKEKGQRPGDIPVYQCSSGLEKPLLWKDFEVFTMDASEKYPFENILM